MREEGGKKEEKGETLLPGCCRHFPQQQGWRPVMAAGEAVRGQHTPGWEQGEIPREDMGQGGILHLWVPGGQENREE